MFLLLDYNEISLSEIRAERFRYQGRIRNRSKALQPGLLSVPNFESDSIGDGSGIMLNYEEKQPATDIVCEYGDSCQYLRSLLEKCSNVENINFRNLTSSQQIIDEEIQHCLIYHKSYTKADNYCVCKCEEDGYGKIDRYVQFHRQFYHGNTIDVDLDMIRDQNQQSIIKYDTSEVKGGTLQFGSPFTIKESKMQNLVI